jgi:hypothetical protein
MLVDPHSDCQELPSINGSVGGMAIPTEGVRSTLLYPQVGINSGLDGRGRRVHHVSEQGRAGMEEDDTDWMGTEGAVSIGLLNREYAGGCSIRSGQHEHCAGVVCTPVQITGCVENGCMEDDKSLKYATKPLNKVAAEFSCTLGTGGTTEEGGGTIDNGRGGSYLLHRIQEQYFQRHSGRRVCKYKYGSYRSEA